MEEDIDMTNQFGITNLPEPIGIKELASKLYVDMNNPSMTKNTAIVDFKDKNPENVRFAKLNSYPALSEYTATKYCVDQSINEPLLVRNIKNIEFND